MVERNGQQLGNYRLVRRLGRGGMAEVYLGEHIFLNTQAAIKLLQAPLPEQDVPAFLREARTIAGLTHPNIVRVLDFGVQDEAFYLIMEYAPRGTLRQNYPPGSRLSAASVVSLIRQIASALQYAHDQNIIHCDVKPENILLGKDNTALLSDFGISMVLQTMTAQQMQHIAGTIAYMAPEQFDGKPQRASDQYALAVMTYEWLSGERPFQGNIAEVSSQHLHARIAPLSKKVAGLPPELDDVLNTAMEKEPARRFGNVSAFARALEQACSALPVEDASSSGEDGPTLLATIAPSPLPTPPALYVASQLQEDTQEGGNNTPPAQKNTDGDHTLHPYRVPPVQGAPANAAGRRAFLIGGGVLVVGAVAAVAASSKLTSLFTPASASSPSPGPATPRATTTTGQTPESSPSTSNIPRGSTLTTYTGQSLDVTGICWSPASAGKMVASCSQDGSAATWNATTGEAAHTFSQSAPLSTIVWSPNGRAIAFAGDAGVIEVWDAASGSPITTCSGHTGPVRGLAWSPDSQRLVSTSEDRTAIVWNAFNGAMLLTYSHHTDKVWVAAWAPNGGSIATGSWDSTVQIWDARSGTLIKSYAASQPVRAVDWSPDSSLIASGGDDDSVQIWQAANGNVLTTYRGHSDHIEAVQWSPDGQSIASASRDHTAQIWQASNANHIYTYTGHSQLVWTLAWSPDGQFIATGSGDKTAKVWQAV